MAIKIYFKQNKNKNGYLLQTFFFPVNLIYF